MPTAQQVSALVGQVRRWLIEAEQAGVYLKVASEKLDDDWLYIVVTPSRPGVRASTQAAFMSKVERELREQGNDQVLLVPALDD